jgi:hypothetical protein
VVMRSEQPEVKDELVARRGEGFWRRWLRDASFRAPLTDWRFWMIEGGVAGLAALHSLLEGAAFMAAWGNLYFLPVALFWKSGIRAPIASRRSARSRPWLSSACFSGTWWTGAGKRS